MNCRAMKKIRSQCIRTKRTCDNCKDVMLQRMCFMFRNCRVLNAYRCKNSKCPYNKFYKAGE